MGSPLGPTFADYYMCHLENNVFEHNPELKPYIYVRYVDDCFLLVSDNLLLSNIKNKFESESVLQFTFEKEKHQQLPFLDTLVKRCNNQFVSSVYIKETNHGDCLNYNSICPDRYKTGVIKTLLHRAFSVCSNWNLLHDEIDRVKQLLTNNNYPMKIIDKTVKEFLDNKIQQHDPSPIKNKVNLYFRGQMSSNYKVEEEQLKQIVTKNVKVVSDEDRINLLIYYKNKKLRNLFIKNKISSSKEISDHHHVVYAYSCNLDGCNSNHKYVGYTTCTVDERFRMHTQAGSIKKHLTDVHNINRVSKKDLISCTKILKSCASKGQLRMTEAILIKSMKPSLNSQEEGCDRLLKIFKH